MALIVQVAAGHSVRVNGCEISQADGKRMKLRIESPDADVQRLDEHGNVVWRNANGSGYQ